MTDGYITRTDAAKMLSVTPRTVTTYARQGKFEGAFKLGQAWAIPMKAVEKLVKARPEGGFKRGRKRGDK